LYTEKGTCDRNKEPGKQLAALFCLLVRFFFLITHQKETLDISNKSTVRIVIKLCQVVAKQKEALFKKVFPSSHKQTTLPRGRHCANE
jgi:lipid II:glycine glycyltransferase (peptidoglycan interpeptide bridge formation enzyme)